MMDTQKWYSLYMASEGWLTKKIADEFREKMRYALAIHWYSKAKKKLEDTLDYMNTFGLKDYPLYSLIETTIIEISGILEVLTNRTREVEDKR